jgi:hypothetical protein
VKPRRALSCIRERLRGHAARTNSHHCESKPMNAKRGAGSAPLSDSSEPSGQVQEIIPAEDMAHVFVVNACVAEADQAFGLVVAVAVTVTFWDGVKPHAEPSPEKYFPALSAA